MRRISGSKVYSDIESNASGMKRRDFIKWIGLFSATFLVSRLPLPRGAESAEHKSESQEEATYYVSGWCIPH